MNLENETGMINVVISVGCWRAHVCVARQSNALIIRGRVKCSGDITNHRRRPARTPPARGQDSSRDFRWTLSQNLFSDASETLSPPPGRPLAAPASREHGLVGSLTSVPGRGARTAALGCQPTRAGRTATALVGAGL